MTPRSKALVHLWTHFLESEAPLRWLTDHCRPATFEHFLVIQDTRIPYHGMPLLDGPVFGHWADGQPDVHAEVPQLIPQEVLNYLESVAQELHHREALAEGGHQPDAANEDAAGAGDNLDARPLSMLDHDLLRKTASLFQPIVETFSPSGAPSQYAWGAEKHSIHVGQEVWVQLDTNPDGTPNAKGTLVKTIVQALLENEGLQGRLPRLVYPWGGSEQYRLPVFEAPSPDWDVLGQEFVEAVFRAYVGQEQLPEDVREILAAHSLPLKRSMLLTTTEGAVVMVHRLQHERLGIIFEAGCRYGEYKMADVHYKTNSQTSPDRYALRAQPIPGNHLVWRLGEHSWTSAIPVVSGDIPSLFSVLHDVVDVPWFEDTGFVPETVELSVEDHDIIRDLRGYAWPQFLEIRRFEPGEGTMDERIPLLGGQRNLRNLSPHPHAYPQVCPAVDQVNQQQNRRWGMSSLEEDHGGVDKHLKRLAMFRRWNDDEVAGFFYDVLETQFLDDAQQRLFFHGPQAPASYALITTYSGFEILGRLLNTAGEALENHTRLAYLSWMRAFEEGPVWDQTGGNVARKFRAWDVFWTAPVPTYPLRGVVQQGQGARFILRSQPLLNAPTSFDDFGEERRSTSEYFVEDYPHPPFRRVEGFPGLDANGVSNWSFDSHMLGTWFPWFGEDPVDAPHFDGVELVTVPDNLLDDLRAQRNPSGDRVEQGMRPLLDVLDNEGLGGEERHAIHDLFNRALERDVQFPPPNTLHGLVLFRNYFTEVGAEHGFLAAWLEDEANIPTLEEGLNLIVAQQPVPPGIQFPTLTVDDETGSMGTQTGGDLRTWLAQGNQANRYFLTSDSMDALRSLAGWGEPSVVMDGAIVPVFEFAALDALRQRFGENGKEELTTTRLLWTVPAQEAGEDAADNETRFTYWRSTQQPGRWRLCTSWNDQGIQGLRLGSSLPCPLRNEETGTLSLALPPGDSRQWTVARHLAFATAVKDWLETYGEDAYHDNQLHPWRWPFDHGVYRAPDAFFEAYPPMPDIDVFQNWRDYTWEAMEQHVRGELATEYLYNPARFANTAYAARAPYANLPGLHLPLNPGPGNLGLTATVDVSLWMLPRRDHGRGQFAALGSTLWCTRQEAPFLRMFQHPECRNFHDGTAEAILQHLAGIWDEVRTNDQHHGLSRFEDLIADVDGNTLDVGCVLHVVHAAHLAAFLLGVEW